MSASGSERRDDSTPDLSIVVVSWNTRDALVSCLKTVRAASERVSLEVIVVDNGSLDGSAEAVASSFPDFKLIANRRNAGFARANNQAFPHCRGRYILLLNPDTEVEAEPLRGLVEFMGRTPDAGAAGLQLLHPDGRRQNSYDNFHSLTTELLSKHLLRLILPRRYPSKRHVPPGPIEVDIVIGACLILRPSLLRQLGGFDDRFFLFVEESDLCYRIRQSGWKVYHVPHLSIRHTFHFSKERAPAHAAIEYARSNYFFFKKHRSRGVHAAFRVLKALRLMLINLPLSLIAVTLTLGLAASQRRRLAIRARLALWHLLGCPASWGMRQVSGFRGYSRRRVSRQGETREILIRDGLAGDVRAALEDPRPALESGEAELLKQSRIKRTFRLRPGGGESAPTVRLTAYRRRRWLDIIADSLGVAPGIHCFERAMEVADQGVPTILPIAAGSTRRLGMVRDSHVAFEEVPGLVKLHALLDVESGVARDTAHRARLRAYGRFVRRLHDAGILQRDLNPGNALVPATAAPDDDASILLVDVERVTVGPPLGWEARVESLARLNRLRAGLTHTDRVRFLHGYFETPVEQHAPGDADTETSPDALRRRLFREVNARMERLRRGDGRRAMRNCVRENWYFGRVTGPDGTTAHFRRRAWPWQESPMLDTDKASELVGKVVRGEELPETLEVVETNGSGGMAHWREANRAFQAGERENVPLLLVRGRAVDRVVSSRRRIDGPLELN